MNADASSSGQRLRLLSYNIQVGISSVRPHHYLTKSWKNVLPTPRRFENLGRIAHVLRDHDIVGLQELDAGSHRTGYVNLTEFLAQQANYPFWHHQVNRAMGPLAQHGNGLLSRYRPTRIVEHRLPGLVPGRGALMAQYGNNNEPLLVMMIHLSLGQRSRMNQLAYISEIINEYPHAILMGDMNCSPTSPELAMLFKRTKLREPLEELHTFPSWRPERSIDHILVTSELKVEHCQVLSHALSDHLPIAMEITLPCSIEMQAG